MTAHCRSRAARGCPKIRCTEAMRSSPSIGRPSSPTRKSTFFWGVARPVCPVHDGGTWLKTAMVSIGRRLAADQPAGFKVCAQLLKRGLEFVRALAAYLRVPNEQYVQLTVMAATSTPAALAAAIPIAPPTDRGWTGSQAR